MVLTREAPLSPPVGRYRTAHWKLASLILAGVLVACAEAPDGELSEYSSFDAAVVVVDAGTPDKQDASTPQVSNGPDATIVPDTPPPKDAGSDAGAANDAATPPRDSGAPMMMMDAGASDAGAVTPPVMDSGTPPAPDTGPPPVVDAGRDTGTVSPPDTGTTNPNMCAATPSYPTTTACAKCTCTKCGSQVTSCYASNDAAKNTQCVAVQACAEKNQCTRAACYCGKGVSTFACAFNQEGACKSVIETAAGTTSPTEVQRIAEDTSTALGRANAIGACQEANCRSECGL